MLRFESAKAVARLVVSAVSQDPISALQSVATLAKIYLVSVENSVRTTLQNVIAVEFSNTSPADVAAIDEIVRQLLERSVIDRVDAAARPEVVVEAILSDHGLVERNALGSEDLASLFDAFLLTAVKEIGKAAKLLPTLAQEAALKALKESARTSARLDEIESQVQGEKERASARQTRVPVEPLVRAHRASLKEYLPMVMDSRDEEILQMHQFALGCNGQWWGWRGDAWCGKSTVMAIALETLETHFEVVPFFINGRQIDSRRREDFVARTLARLAQICGEEALPSTFFALDVDMYRSYLLRASETCAARGHTLVYLIDGLDEDVGAGAASILAVLPTILPENVRVIVSARPVPLPRDLHPNHPLHQPGTWHELEKSPLAEVARSTAEDDVTELLSTALGRSVAEVLAAAGAALTAADLAELTGESAARLKRDVLARREGRCLATTSIPPIDPRDVGPKESGYRLAHEEVLREVVLSLQPQAVRAESGTSWQEAVSSALAPARARLIAWAAKSQERSWPLTTPRYLIREYGEFLASNGNYGELLDLVFSAGRQDLLDKAWGVPWRAEQDLITALTGFSRRDPTNFSEIASLRIALDLRATSSRLVEPMLPEAWARLGCLEYADFLAQQATGFQREEALARLLRFALQTGDTARAQQLVEMLGVESPTVSDVVLAAQEDLDRQTLLARLRHSDELPWDEAWYLQAEFADIEAVQDQSAVDVVDSAYTFSEGEKLTASLLSAAAARDEGMLVSVAERMDWGVARHTSSGGRVTMDGRAVAIALVKLGATGVVLDVLRSQLAGFAEPELVTDETYERYSQAEDAAWMMGRLAMAMRELGHPDEADRIALEIPQAHSMDDYWQRAAIDAADEMDGEAAVTYLSRVVDQMGLAQGAASAALLLAWRGAPCAHDVTKAAEEAGHVMHLADYAFWTLLMLSRTVIALELDREVLKNLLLTSGKLLNASEGRRLTDRFVDSLSDLLCTAWPLVDGQLILSAVGDNYLTGLVRTHLAVEASREKSYENAINHLRFVPPEHAHQAAEVLVSETSASDVALLADEPNAPNWLVSALEHVHDQYAQEEGYHASDTGWAATANEWPSTAALAELARGREEVERLNSGAATGVTELVEVSRALATMESHFDDHLLYTRELIALATCISAIEAIHTGISATDGDARLSAALTDIVRKCFELGHPESARRMILSINDEFDRDAGLRALFDSFRVAGDESSAEECVGEMRDYERDLAYRDLAIDAIQGGRRESVRRYMAWLEIGDIEVLREVRQAELSHAMSHNSSNEVERLTATYLAQWEFDDYVAAILTSIDPPALLAASRRAVIEAEAILNHLAATDAIRGVAVRLRA